MSDEAKNVLVESCDSKATILAAISRIKEVSVGVTLIDSISDADWMDESASHWKIEAGSDDTSLSEELDDCDKEFVKVA